MDNIGEFLKKYRGAIIGIIIAVLIFVTKLYNLVFVIAVIVVGAILIYNVRTAAVQSKQE